MSNDLNSVIAAIRSDPNLSSIEKIELYNQAVRSASIVTLADLEPQDLLRGGAWALGTYLASRAIGMSKPAATVAASAVGISRSMTRMVNPWDEYRRSW